VLDANKVACMHDSTKVVRDDNKNTDVVEWTKVVRKKGVRKRRTPDQPTGRIRQSVSQSVSQSKVDNDEGSRGHAGPRKATRWRKGRKEG
jgi:hypothetical protein